MPFDGFPEFCLILTAGIVVFEVVMFAALAVGRVFHHPAMPGLLLLFVWGTFLFRGEYTFFSLVCFLFFLAKPRMPTLWKALILASMVIFLALDAGEAGTVL